jgi:hypothetical protein
MGKAQQSTTQTGLGKHGDEDLTRQLGRSQQSVEMQRLKLKICSGRN